MENEKKLVPLKELVPFDVFQQIFEKMMENEERRRLEEELDGTPRPKSKE